MNSNPKADGDHINGVIAGWDEHAQDASFAGMTLAQFKVKVKPSLDARDLVSTLERQLAAARVERNNADVVSLGITASVVNSVKGDLNHGENSALYASFGYVRKVDRKSGLVRPANNVVEQAPELKVAA
jgi:hypothetical protein